MILELILSGIVQLKTIQNIGEQNARTSNNTGTIQQVVFNNSDRGDYNIGFFGGDSVVQIAARKAEEERILSEASNQRSQRSPGESFTGNGKAEVIGESWEQCVTYAKRRSGITRPIGYAGNAKIQGETPKVGSIGIERARVGHAVYIESINEDQITISEANYMKGKITRRVLSISQFRGFIYS